MSWEPINDAMFAIEVWRNIGFGRGVIDLYLKERWYDDQGLITPLEWRAYCRNCARQNLSAYRRARGTKPESARIFMSYYKAWKEELK